MNLYVLVHVPSDAGASDNPCTNVYQGIRPASEIETQNIQKEILRISEQQKIESFVTIHTAARLVLTPWGSVLDPGTEEICEYTKPEEHNEMVSSNYLHLKLV